MDSYRSEFIRKKDGYRLAELEHVEQTHTHTHSVTCMGSFHLKVMIMKKFSAYVAHRIIRVLKL